MPVCSTRPVLGDKAPIRQMQAFLNKAGPYSIPEDGVFGPNTDNTVKDWQKKNGLIVDGKVANQTWPTLCDAACKLRPTLAHASPNKKSVAEMQTLLNKAGGYSMPADGDFGNNTVAKVKDWQRRNGLAVDGVVAAQTWPTLCECRACKVRPRLVRGSNDKVAVLQMQALLNNIGGYRIPEDGDFGGNTQNTVKDWQAKNKLIVDGVVAGQTWPTLCDTVCKTKPRLSKGYDAYGQVRQTQVLLNAAGGYTLSLDGDFGNQTDRTVRDWQTKNGLIVDGIVGNQTWPTLCDPICKSRPSLSKGSPNKRGVKEMQTLLNDKGGYNMPVDGDFGNNTDGKVRDWQKRNGLAVDGVVGAQTWPTLCDESQACKTRPRLQKGSADKRAVLEMQAALNKAGGYSIPEDGLFGGNTENTVKDWQNKNGRVVDGIVGGQTWPTLCDCVCEVRPVLGDKALIKEMQALLNKAGGYHIPEDGIYGSNTEKTVKDWQTKSGIFASGIVGPATWDTLCTDSLITDAVKGLDSEMDALKPKLERFRNLDFFILDNSIRECTVGQLRSHTIENKKKIYAESKKCHMHSMIVASFAQLHRVDDEFCQWLKDSGEDFSKLFSFSEVTEGVKDGRFITDEVPISLKKNKTFGLYNTFFEVDLADSRVEWGTKWSVHDMCKLIEKWMDWVFDNIHKDARILINFRDLPAVMVQAPERILAVVEFLSKMPEDRRMFALAYEDPMGESLPAEMAAWTRAIRNVMTASGWNGRLLNHIHEKWEFQTSATMECLAAGGDGVWAGMCVEGAAMGHASSTVTLLNLVRLGNQKVLKTYNCTGFRNSAIEVTKLTTTKKPHPKQCVYGERALDLVFGFLGVGDFNLGDFFGERTENRMTTLATPQMIVDRLTFLFGADPQFTLEMGEKMKVKMLDDLNSTPPRKEEYQSAMGLAVLLDRTGGKLTGKMSDAIAAVEDHQESHKRIIAEIRELWDEWDMKETHKKDDALQFDSFYNAFLSPYFGCYRCADTKQAMSAIDMDDDHCVDWNEFLVYIKWALAEKPNVAYSDEVLEMAIQEGLIPAMRDEKIKNQESHSGFRHLP